jgi:hypothetical protein
MKPRRACATRWQTWPRLATSSGGPREDTHPGTGASGLIGAALCSRLLERGHELAHWCAVLARRFRERVVCLAIWETARA